VKGEASDFSPKNLSLERKLSILRGQIMKNKRPGRIQIIKNPYDADWVKVSFQNFADNYFIEDNGCGMALELLKITG
jgi:hypothetical protein